MSGEREVNILDMDFGELIAPDNSFINPPIEGEETGNEEKEEKHNPPVEEEEEINVNDVLENPDEGDEEEEEGENEEKSPGSSSVKSEEKSSEQNSSDGDEPFTLVLARYQLEQGVLSSLDENELMKVHDEDGPAAAMSYLLKKEIESNLDSIKTEYDGFAQEYQELRKLGYTAQEAGEAIGDLENLENIKADDLSEEGSEDLRRAIMKENYKATTKFSEDKIDRLIKRSFDLGDDIEDAQEAIESLKEVRKEELTAKKQQKLQEQKQNEDHYKAQLQALNDKINNLQEIIPGQKLTKATKDKLLKTITTPVKNDDSGMVMNAIWAKRNEDPIQFDTMLAYLLNVGVFEGKWDSILRSAGTKVSSKIEEKLNNTTSTGFIRGGKRTTSTDRRKEVDDMIGPMKNVF